MNKPVKDKNKEPNPDNPKRGKKRASRNTSVDPDHHGATNANSTRNLESFIDEATRASGMSREVFTRHSWRTIFKEMAARIENQKLPETLTNLHKGFMNLDIKKYATLAKKLVKEVSMKTAPEEINQYKLLYEYLFIFFFQLSTSHDILTLHPLPQLTMIRDYIVLEAQLIEMIHTMKQIKIPPPSPSQEVSERSEDAMFSNPAHQCEYIMKTFRILCQYGSYCLANEFFESYYKKYNKEDDQNTEKETYNFMNRSPEIYELTPAGEIETYSTIFHFFKETLDNNTLLMRSHQLTHFAKMSLCPGEAMLVHASRFIHIIHRELQRLALITFELNLTLFHPMKRHAEKLKKQIRKTYKEFEDPVIEALLTIIDSICRPSITDPSIEQSDSGIEQGAKRLFILAEYLLRPALESIAHLAQNFPNIKLFHDRLIEVTKVMLSQLMRVDVGLRMRLLFIEEHDFLTYLLDFMKAHQCKIGPVDVKKLEELARFVLSDKNFMSCPKHSKVITLLSWSSRESCKSILSKQECLPIFLFQLKNIAVWPEADRQLIAAQMFAIEIRGSTHTELKSGVHTDLCEVFNIVFNPQFKNLRPAFKTELLGLASYEKIRDLISCFLSTMREESHRELGYGSIFRSFIIKSMGFKKRSGLIIPKDLEVEIMLENFKRLTDGTIAMSWQWVLYCLFFGLMIQGLGYQNKALFQAYFSNIMAQIRGANWTFDDSEMRPLYELVRACLGPDLITLFRQGKLDLINGILEIALLLFEGILSYAPVMKGYYGKETLAFLYHSLYQLGDWPKNSLEKTILYFPFSCQECDSDLFMLPYYRFNYQSRFASCPSCKRVYFAEEFVYSLKEYEVSPFYWFIHSCNVYLKTVSDEFSKKLKLMEVTDEKTEEYLLDAITLHNSLNFFQN